MKNLIKRVRELLSMNDKQLAKVYCFHINSADLDKYEWRIFQGRKDYIREIISHEFAG